MKNFTEIDEKLISKFQNCSFKSIDREELFDVGWIVEYQT